MRGECDLVMRNHVMSHSNNSGDASTDPTSLHHQPHNGSIKTASSTTSTPSTYDPGTHTQTLTQ